MSGEGNRWTENMEEEEVERERGRGSERGSLQIGPGCRKGSSLVTSFGYSKKIHK